MKVDVDPTTALLAETQQGRAWDRVRRQLDAGVAISDVIVEAGAIGDVATLRALRTEAVSYLQTSLAEAGKPGNPPLSLPERERLEERIDRAEAPHLSRRQRDAVEAKWKLPKVEVLLETKRGLVDAMVAGQGEGRAMIAAALAAAFSEVGSEADEASLEHATA